MNKHRAIFQSGWAIFFLISFIGFTGEPQSIALLLATLSALTPLLISTFFTNRRFDPSFLSILVLSLQLVAIAVCLAQPLILNAGQLKLVLIPLVSMALWIIYQRKTIEKI